MVTAAAVAWNDLMNAVQADMIVPCLSAILLARNMNSNLRTAAAGFIHIIVLTAVSIVYLLYGVRREMKVVLEVQL